MASMSAPEKFINKLDIFSKAVLIVAILSSFSAYAMIAGAVTELMKKI